MTHADEPTGVHDQAVSPAAETTKPVIGNSI
jgi:hypothetical protein